MRPNVPERSSSNDSNPLQREARIHSIYDKYLYDAKDLHSADPRLRQLARQASLAHHHHNDLQNKNNNNKPSLSIIHDDNEELQSNRTMSSASSSAPLVKRAAFGQGTKLNDAPSSGHKRDESAGGVWAGFIAGGVASDDESDSDDDDDDANFRPPASTAASPSPATPSRASWTSRAAAVGSRPPDSASQNPLSLKLLGLKSLKDGGTGSRSPNTSSSANERSFDIVQYAPSSSRFDVERSQESEEAQRSRNVEEEINKSRIQSQSDYGDTAAEEVDRHGSTINFGGAGAGGLSALDEYMNHRARDSRALQEPPINVTRAPPEPMRSSPEMPEQQGGALTTHALKAGRPVSPRTALTRQLGLASSTPSPLPKGSERSDYFGGEDASPRQAFQYASSNGGYSPAPSSQPPLNGVSPPRGALSLPLSSLRGGTSAAPPPHESADPFGGGGPGVPLQRGPPPVANGGSMSNTAAAASALPPAHRGSPSPPQGVSRGAPPPPGSLRPGAPQPPPNAMQRGQPTQYGNGPPPPPPHQQQQQQQRGMLPGFSSVPPPNGGAPLPSPRGPAPPNGFRGAPPPGQHQQGGLRSNAPPGRGGGPFPRGAPPPGPPGFSDARQAPYGALSNQQRRSNVFRRSMAFMTGQGGGQSQQGGLGAQRGLGGGGGPAGAPPPQQRRSMLRRSMAFFTGRNAPPPPVAAVVPDDDDDANAPQPRVRGFVDDEKHVQRQSQYLGASGMGDEWDVSGAGSKFWRRFSQAQRAAQKPDPVSQRWRDKALSGRKRVNCLAALGLLCIVGAIVGIILWRESKNKASDTPGSINRADFGGTNAAGTVVAQPTTLPAAAAVGGVDAATDDGSGTGADAADDEATTKHRGRHTRTRRRSRTRTLDNRDLATPAMLTTLAPRTPAQVSEAIQEAILDARKGPHPLPRKRSGSARRRIAWQGEKTLHRTAPEPLQYVRKLTEKEKEDA